MLKGDLVNSAYSKLRISGLTVDPSPEDVVLGLNTLEDMLAEWEDVKNICLSYNFETFDTVDAATDSNLPRWSVNSVIYCLASRLVPNFNKQVPPQLELQRNAAFSTMSTKAAQVRQIQNPRRMPRGSGNVRWNEWQRFAKDPAEAPISCTTNDQVLSTVNNYSTDFSDLLLDGESVSSYTYDKTDGLTVTGDTLSNNVVSYTVTTTNKESYEYIIFNINIDSGRTDKRQVNFNVISPPAI